MDDHMLRHTENGWAYPPGFTEIIVKHLWGARRVMVISPALAEFYRHEFDIESSILFGPADPIGEPVWQRPYCGDVCRLGYFGFLGDWQLDALVKLGTRLRNLNATLDVFSATSELPDELRLPGVTMRGKLSADEVLHRMRKYDAVVLPISFSEGMRHLTEFNIATKMSECLASGT